MPGTEEIFTLPKCSQGDEKMVDFNQDFTVPGVSSPPQRMRQNDNGILFQLSGTATSFQAVVERSTRDPLRETANWAPAESEDWSGSLVTGTAPRAYNEPSRGWWRLRVISVSGGVLQLNIMGERA